MDYNKSWEQKLKHMDGRVLIWWIYIQSKGFLKIDFKVNSIIQIWNDKRGDSCGLWIEKYSQD